MMLIIAYFGTAYFPFFSHPKNFGLGTTLFIFFYITAVLLYALYRTDSPGAKKSGGFSLSHISREGLFWYGVLFALALSLSLYINESLVIWATLLIRIGLMYYTLCITRGLIDGSTGSLLFLDILHMALLIPLGGFFAQYKLIHAALSRNRVLFAAAKILLGVVAALPLLALIISLLAFADENFYILIESILDYLSEKLSAFFRIFLFSLLPGLFLFAIAFNSKHKRRHLCLRVDSESLRRRSSAVSIIPAMGFYGVLSII